MYRPIAALAVAAVVWNGPVDFSAGQPRVAVAQTGPLSGLPAGGPSATPRRRLPTATSWTPGATGRVSGSDPDDDA